MRRLRLDFETASACDLRKAGAWRYAEDPTTEVVSLTWRLSGSNHEPVLWSPYLSTNGNIEALEELNDHARNTDILFVAHNTGFEKAIWRRIMMEQYGLPDVPNSRWHDTQAMCAMRVIPQDLARSVTVLRLPFHKDAEGSKITKALSKPDKRGYYDRSAATLARVFAYNKSDILSTECLDDRLGDLPTGERQVWLLDQRINERGVRLDLAFVRAAQAIVDRASGPLLTEFSTLTGGLAPTQVQKFQAWLKSEGCHIPDLKKETLIEVLGHAEGDDDEDAEPESLADDGTVPTRSDYRITPAAKRALEIRQLVGSASIKKLARMETCICTDGRARGLLQYHGAGPGLWAGRLFQPQNFPRGSLKLGKKAPDPSIVVDAIMTKDPDYVETVLGTPAVECVVSSLRHAIIASPGRTIVAGDFAGIQARTVLAMAGQHDKTELMASGADVYIDMAKSIFKRDDLTKEANPEERQIGKNTVLGLGFQMGAAKFRDRYAKDHPPEFSENVVKVYRKEWAPNVPHLWYALNDASAKAVWDHCRVETEWVTYEPVDGWLTAILPSGRRLWYFNPQKVRTAMPWDETDIRRGWTYQAMKFGQWRTIHAFGGLLTENAVMACQRDLLVAAMFKCEKNGFPVILNVHDEIITEPLSVDANPDTLVQMMTDIPQWAKDMQIPVAVEAWAGDRYRK